MGNSKIVYYGETLIDLTGDTVEAAKLLKGVTAHDKKGEKITGTLSDVTQATPAITVDAAGKITASATQAAGVVAAGTKSATKQLTVQAAKTVTPSASAQTAVAKGVFTTGIITVAAVYAVIGVTYPSGSTVTCTNGSKTLTAKDTTGKAMFVIPYAGTWTVKAVKGSKSKSTAVKITTQGQFKTVTLAYERYIFKKGQGAIVPLSVDKEVNGQATIGTDKITLSKSNNSSCGVGVYTTSKQDLSQYTTLYADVEMTSQIDTLECYLCVKSTAGRLYNNGMGTANILAYTSVHLGSSRFSVDISSVNNGYIVFGDFKYGTITNIWMQ